MTRQFIVIIEKMDYETARFIDQDEITKMLDEIAINYYFILHDKDINNDKGEIVRPHYHLVFTTAKRVRLGTILNRISKILNIAKLGITIDIAFNYNYHIRYLMHLDDKEKYAYDPNLITTNDEKGLEYAQRSKTDKIDTETLIESCNQTNSRIALMRLIGIGNYITFYRAIDDIYKELYEKDN
ncbi:MAG: Rep family protein [Vulcanibacillus sp.]